MGAGPEVRLFRYASEFVEVAEPFLLAEEERHCLLLGLLPALGSVRGPFLAAVGLGDAPALVALRTPPHRLILSEVALPGDAAEAVALLVGAAPADLPGVVGPPRESAAFAAAWTARHGGHAEVDRHDLIYRCREPVAPRGVPGRMVRAGRERALLLAAWRREFTREALPGEALTARAAAAVVGSELAWREGGLWLWEVDGEPVSMAGARGPTRHGIRIGPVYTPPVQRGRGYAGALTAELTRLLLAAGRAHVTLFTDAANPVSNRLYQAIGYCRVGEQDVHDFRPGEGGGDPA